MQGRARVLHKCACNVLLAVVVVPRCHRQLQTQSGFAVLLTPPSPPPSLAQAPPLRKHHYPVKPSVLEPFPILPIQASAPCASTTTW